MGHPDAVDDAGAVANGVAGVTAEEVLAARGIRKSFADVEVLHGVDFSVRRGEVHGLVGQNGAGKSTLVKIISGAYTEDAGEVEILGRPAERPRQGIAMVFQEFSLVPSMTVTQNIVLNREPRTRLGLVDDGAATRLAADALRRLGADIDPGAAVEDLPVGARQLVEIAKAISRDAAILILDEPTASLTATEAATLIATIRRLREQGISIVYISHHLAEVMEICDRITVVRDGSVTLVAEPSRTSLAVIIEHMLGRPLEHVLGYAGRDVDRDGPPLLRVDSLRTARLRDVSFELRGGEILGIAGLLGSGRTEVMRAIFGIDRLLGGAIELRGRPVSIGSPAAALAAGIALVPEDRARAGLVRDHRVGDNILMAGWSRFVRRGLVDDGAARGRASELVTTLGIRTQGLDQEVRRLSGGNQQKVVVAKNLVVAPSVLLLDDPTVGVDIGSRIEILAKVRELAVAGNGILLVSSELEELSALADRVLVMREGAIVAALDRAAGDDLSEAALSQVVAQVSAA